MHFPDFPTTRFYAELPYHYLKSQNHVFSTRGSQENYEEARQWLVANNGDTPLKLIESLLEAHYYDRAWCFWNRRDMYMTPHQYLLALRRRVECIVAGESLSYYDDTTMGDKELYCSWGMCGKRIRFFPDAEFYNPKPVPDWPLDSEYVVFPKRSPHYMECPFSRRPDSHGSGCFYFCDIFKHREIPTKEQALAKYASRIKEVEELIPQLHYWEY